jgi:pimeloyl-ACP methyl ester carboxylesterase
MWGAKKGLWITSYLGYLQQYFDIVFYDCQQLASIDLAVETEENVREAFQQGGTETAIAHLLNKEGQDSAHFLAFGIGGFLAWKAGLQGLKMKSLYAVSSPGMSLETQKLDCRTTLLYGGNDSAAPGEAWELSMGGVALEKVPHFGHELYSDDKIIQKICQELLGRAIKKQLQA